MALQRGRKGGPPITPMARKTGQSPEFMSLNQCVRSTARDAGTCDVLRTAWLTRLLRQGA